jgi:FAD/FMN-containing dehydrogenase
MAMLVYVGEVGAAERALAPFRALGKPLADMLRPMRYPEIYQPEPEGCHPIGSGRTLFVDSINQGVAETILDYLRTSTATMAVAQLRVLGGAMARVPENATAFAHRSSRIMVNVAALYEKPEEKSIHEAQVTAYAAALRQGYGGAYVNFLADEGPERVRDAYPGPTWERLAGVKARYDPTNLFHLNQNIPPKTTADQH